MEKLMHELRRLIINTPTNIPISKDAEYVRDIENLMYQARMIARKYNLKTEND